MYWGSLSLVVSVKRCYEGVRRNFLETQEGKEDFVLDQSKRRKYRSRRQRVSCLLAGQVTFITIAMCTTEVRQKIVCCDNNRAGKILAVFVLHVYDGGVR